MCRENNPPLPPRLELQRNRGSIRLPRETRSRSGHFQFGNALNENGKPLRRTDMGPHGRALFGAKCKDENIAQPNMLISTILSQQALISRNVNQGRRPATTIAFMPVSTAGSRRATARGRRPVDFVRTLRDQLANGNRALGYSYRVTPHTPSQLHLLLYPCPSSTRAGCNIGRETQRRVFAWLLYEDNRIHLQSMPPRP
uniref:Uncharacterized protein n=1 Tax=Coccidioides posadasii RMSCC 3488 TaxID=454284 RepID=A0A0J6FT67_COCPO|nr:hypothetical protein CPAG_08586 [Coccidioides posadasii RMSCC 3488]